MKNLHKNFTHLKFIFPVFAILLSSVFTILSPVMVSAASQWDYILNGKDPNYAETCNLSTYTCEYLNQAQITDEIATFCGDSYASIFNSSISSGGYAVGKYQAYKSPIVDEDTLVVYFTPTSDDNYFTFTDTAAQRYVLRLNLEAETYRFTMTNTYGATSGFCSDLGSSGAYDLVTQHKGGTNQSYCQVTVPITDTCNTNYLIGSNYNVPSYPIGYVGNEVSPDFTKKIQVHPGMSVIVQANEPPDTSKVKLIFADTWSDFLNANGLPPPDYSIFTLTDMEDNIIISDRCWGPSGCDWNNLPNGEYKARVDVIYLDPGVNASYSFNTTEVWFQVNGTSYTMLHNPNEGKYCTVRNGYEWNCDIPQPGDEPSLVTGEPEEWIQEECTKEAFPWIDLGACIRNSLHYLGEYLGINGPSISAGASPFFQFDTNTFGLTSIITAPITILNNLAGSEYTCSTVNLPLPYMSDDLELPCMNSYYSTYLGDLYTLWQTVINGIVSYFVIVGMLRMVKDSKDPQKDKIEVLSL